MEVIGCHGGGNMEQLPLVELMYECTIIVATIVLFLAHK
jgi:hypothetical protein